MLHRFGFCSVFGLVCWLFLRNMSMTHLNVQYLVPGKTLSYSPPVGAATIRFGKMTSIWFFCLTIKGPTSYSGYVLGCMFEGLIPATHIYCLEDLGRPGLQGDDCEISQFWGLHWPFGFIALPWWIRLFIVYVTLVCTPMGANKIRCWKLFSYCFFDVKADRFF